MKPPLWNARDGRHRITCCYCKRQLQAHNKDASDGLTFDHVRAEAAGGWKKVPCCHKCNFLKDDIGVEDWFWFIATHPRWWKEFSNPSQVKRVVREFRFAQAQARAVGASKIWGDPPPRLRREPPKIGRHNLG